MRESDAHTHTYQHADADTDVQRRSTTVKHRFNSFFKTHARYLATRHFARARFAKLADRAVRGARFLGRTQHTTPFALVHAAQVSTHQQVTQIAIMLHYDGE
jgi:hypothetical protein